VKRLLSWCIAAVLTIIAVASFKEAHSSAGALLRSQAAWENGKKFEAVLEARDAAQSLAPFSSTSEQAYQALEKYGSESETKGDFQTSAIAWRAMRAASVSTESPFHSTIQWRAKAEAGLLRISLRGFAASEGARTEQNAPTAADLDKSFEHSRALQRSTFAVVAFSGIAFFLLAYFLTSKMPRKSISDDSVADRES